MIDNTPVIVELTKVEALILFDWLDTVGVNTSINIDEKIFTVLSNIESSLESILEEPFQENYKALVQEAKRSI
jgi:hypothetical protein